MISIIGSGPAGGMLAYELAKAGLDVQIFEDHKCVGAPIQCTGILTESFHEIMPANEIIDELKIPKKEFLVNTIKRISVNSPDGNSAVLNMKKKDYIVNRTLFDSYFADKAIDSGAKLFLNNRFMDFDSKNNLMKIRDTKNNEMKEIKTDILVGADGPLSSVAKSAGIYGNRKILVGVQAVLKTECEKDKFDTYFGSNFPKFFGWFVPESDDIARVGLAAYENPRALFDSFIKKFNGKILEMQGGPIPVYQKAIQIQKDNVFLVGDSACQIKNTTGGGIVFSMIAAKTLADCIVNNKDYPTEIKKKIGKDLFVHDMIRKTLDRFSDNDYNKLVSMIGKEKVKEVLENNEREFPSKFIARLLIAEPGFLRFGSKLIGF